MIFKPQQINKQEISQVTSSNFGLTVDQRFASGFPPVSHHIAQTGQDMTHLLPTATALTLLERFGSHAEKRGSAQLARTPFLACFRLLWCNA
jgi:hypothetical protein